MAKRKVAQSETSAAADNVRERAQQLDLISEMLCRAHRDSAWRLAVERALTKERLLGKSLPGGSKVGDVWRKSLLQKQLVLALYDDPVAFDAFAKTHPRVAELSDSGDEHAQDVLQEFDPIERVLVAAALFRDDIAFYDAVLAEACDELERHESECKESPGEQLTPEDDANASAAREALDAATKALKQAQAALLARDKELKAAKAELKKAKAEVSRRDRKAGELREASKVVAGERDTATAETKALRAERDELKRENRRLTSLVDSSKTGQRTIETKRADETERMSRTITDLRDRLGATQKTQAALEARVAALEEELQDERERRASFEGTLHSFGVDDLGSSARGLQSALATLARFQDGLVAYSAEQAERENERIRKQDEAEQRRKAAEDARQQQDEMDRAWELRERSRLEECERALFPDGPIDHILIDGHNLVHRVFRPEDEARTRPWLEKMVDVMALKLDARGWTTRIELVFDTKYVSNSRGAGRGVTVHFHNNVNEGGADAKIQQLLQEGNPGARYMVVSTDRKHVWGDTLEKMQSEDMNIELVQIELLAQYLQTLDELTGA